MYFNYLIAEGILYDLDKHTSQSSKFSLYKTSIVLKYLVISNSYVSKNFKGIRICYQYIFPTLYKAVEVFYLAIARIFLFVLLYFASRSLSESFCLSIYYITIYHD